MVFIVQLSTILFFQLNVSEDRPLPVSSWTIAAPPSLPANRSEIKSLHVGCCVKSAFKSKQRNWLIRQQPFILDLDLKIQLIWTIDCIEKKIETEQQQNSDGTEWDNDWICRLIEIAAGVFNYFYKFFAGGVSNWMNRSKLFHICRIQISSASPDFPIFSYKFLELKKKLIKNRVIRKYMQVFWALVPQNKWKIRNIFTLFRVLHTETVLT